MSRGLAIVFLLGGAGWIVDGLMQTLFTTVFGIVLMLTGWAMWRFGTFQKQATMPLPSNESTGPTIVARGLVSHTS